MEFYKTVFMIMLVVLFISLSIVGYAIYNSKNDKKYPPIVSECPDYYELSGNICTDVHGLNNGNDYNSGGASQSISCESVNFSLLPKSNNAGMGPNSAICEKKKWANTCGVNWDGITNDENICYSKNT